MKVATVILSLYVLILAVMPCPCSKAAERFADNAQGAEMSCDCHDHGGAPDLCTPFCVVSQCMHTPVAFFRNALDITPAAALSGKASPCRCQEKPVIMFKGTIWHPPICRA